MKDHPQIRSIKAAVCDINGVYRGKRLPVTKAEKLFRNQLKLPVSVLFPDIWGQDVASSPYVLHTGDSDGILSPIHADPIILNDQNAGTAILPMWAFSADGEPCLADPRQVLAGICARYRAKNLTPVCATELEFFLFTRGDGAERPQKAGLAANMYGLNELERVEPFLDDVYRACDRCAIAADAAISESGLGQFEINFEHQPDPLIAADHAQLFKYIVKTVAARHGFGATFMAKPFGDEAGSGFHTHFSILDENGKNVFSDGSDKGSDLLRFAVGGLLATLADSMLVFGPHANSYRRFAPSTHAPVSANWGYDNRTTALRIPASDDAARRIEHRVAGADANPYLVLSIVLAGALKGIEEEINPDAPVEGNGYQESGNDLPTVWQSAVERFERSKHVREMLGDMLTDVLVLAKRQEIERFRQEIPTSEYTAYLNTI